MMIEVASVDEALTTTRAVRRRLDLERPVDDQIIFDCIDVAEQAPSGGNQGSRRWMIVRDPALKAKIAELSMESGGAFMIEAARQLDGTGHPQERVMRSAAYLAEHLAEVPAIVVPTIIGRHDGSGRPGLFDSVIQAVWSFCVALRARGLGTAWTTAGLSNADAVAELLGVPIENTQIALIPVAWSKGTDFKRAPRYPAREISFLDRYGLTWQSGPGAPPSLADGPGAIAEIDVRARADAVWAVISNPLFLARASGADEGGWLDGATEPSVGAAFTGPAEPFVQRDERCVVDRCVEPHELGWVIGDPATPSATLRFDIAAIAGASRIRHSITLGTGLTALSDAIDREPSSGPVMIRAAVARSHAVLRGVLGELAAELPGEAGR